MTNNEELDNFEPVAKIIVIGVGGAGSNAVNRMIDEHISNVQFFVMNTDKQAISLSKAPNRIILGESLTNGLGAGGDPSVGKAAAESSSDVIQEIVQDCNMVFIAGGMGGGTGTGAAPVIARIAKEAGALVVGVVTRPFNLEGNKKNQYAIEGLNELKNNCDSIIVVSNDKLLMEKGNMPIANAFAEADKVLTLSVKTVTDLILMPAIINLDFADVKNTLADGGVALIGFGSGSGEHRAEEAARSALTCPLIEQSIDGATKAICHVTTGPDVSLYDSTSVVNKIIEQSGNSLDLKFGISINDQLGDQILVSIIASGFQGEIDFSKPNITQSRTTLEEIAARQNDFNNFNLDGSSNDTEDDLIPSFLSDKDF